MAETADVYKTEPDTESCDGWRRESAGDLKVTAGVPTDEDPCCEKADPRAWPAPQPFVRFTPGELLDRFTIWSLKVLKCQDIKRGMQLIAELVEIGTTVNDLINDHPFVDHEKLGQAVTELTEINEKLWNCEDAVRVDEVSDAEFLVVAKAIPILNDRRSACKHVINKLYNSPRTEQKIYKKS